MPNGLVIWCFCEWLVWPSGQTSQGVPRYAAHSVFDAAGAARRLAQSGQGIVNTMRALALGGPVEANLLKSIAWLAGIFIVFAPLSVRAYRRAS